MEHRVNSIQKKALELVYEDFLDLTFQELLAKGKSVGVHQNNLQLGATVIFESEIGMSPELMNHIFQFVERPCNLRWNYTSERKQDYTVYHGSESLSFLVSKLWDVLPNSRKNSTPLKEFKTKINIGQLTTILAEYTRNNKKYVGRIGFI